MPRILLVEDNPLLGSQLTGLFAEAGHVLEWATSVATARLLLDCQPFQGMILDLDLPDGSGLEVCRHAAIRSGACAVWVVSGGGEGRLGEARHWPGVAGAWAKPVDGKCLLEAFERHLSRSPASRYPQLISQEERQWLLTGAALEGDRG